MSYSPISYETYGDLIFFKTKFSSSAGSIYPIMPKRLGRQNETYIPIFMVAHYDNLTGNWGGGASYNIGYTAPGYTDWISGSALDVSSRATNNMTNISLNTNEIFPTGSIGNEVYFRFNTNNTIGTLTGSILVAAFISKGS